MRKIMVCILLIGVLCGLCIQAGATPVAKSLSGYATVSSDGSCQVTLTANVQLDGIMENLRFPLPAKASHVTVNGSRAGSRLENGVRQVDISRFVGKAAGEFSLTFTYSLPDMIVTNDVGQLELRMPVLAGFAYPVQSLELSVTLPGPVTAKPAFSSGYHQANIEKDLYCTTQGATITAVSQTELKDHETLTMTLLVTEEMFPQTRIVAPDFQTVNTLITVFLVLALVYWMLFLRNLPLWPTRRAIPPLGYTAGELPALLHLQGADLSMMVFSWAQLGYLSIHRKPDGTVLLYRQMDMGNERSAFEQRCFKQLFGSRSMADTDTRRYGELCRAVEKMRPNVAELVHQRSGNLLVFRGIAAMGGMFCGVAFAISMASGAVLQWLLILLLGALAMVSSWYIQLWAVNIAAADRRQVWIALGLCGVWLLLGALAGLPNVGVILAVGQLSAGVFLALGGRRTLTGRQAMAEAMGLRRYLRSISKEELKRLCGNDPDYFHRMFPYAMALGVERAFSKKFGKISVGICPYVDAGVEHNMRAAQWCEWLRRVYRSMNAHRQDRWKEKLGQLIRLFTR